MENYKVAILVVLLGILLLSLPGEEHSEVTPPSVAHVCPDGTKRVESRSPPDQPWAQLGPHVLYISCRSPSGTYHGRFKAVTTSVDKTGLDNGTTVQSGQYKAGHKIGTWHADTSHNPESTTPHMIRTIKTYGADGVLVRYEGFDREDDLQLISTYDKHKECDDRFCRMSTWYEKPKRKRDTYYMVKDKRKRWVKCGPAYTYDEEKMPVLYHDKPKRPNCSDVH